MINSHLLSFFEKVFLFLSGSLIESRRQVQFLCRWRIRGFNTMESSGKRLDRSTGDPSFAGSMRMSAALCRLKEV